MLLKIVRETGPSRGEGLAQPEHPGPRVVGVVRPLHLFVTNETVDLPKFDVETIFDWSNVLKVDFLEVRPSAEIEATDEVRIPAGVKLHFEAAPVGPGSIGLGLSLQHKLSKIRPELIGIHIEYP